MEATRLRLLPWPGENGKPTYTPDDSPNSTVARLADRLEIEQTATAEAVLALAKGLLDSGLRLEPDECAYLMRRVAECLADMLRVAESRGGRLPAPNPLEPEAGRALEGKSPGATS
ncbi:hypothetical protein [Streptomyces iranensis]|uniref:hypothetical protein n=1 Tax=Streptomyces iranensis TaxID=576784 RepID=UPI0039B788AA